MQPQSLQPNKGPHAAGRQCLASSLLLRGEFGEALPYLESIGEFCAAEDAYQWNLGMAKAAVGREQEPFPMSRCQLSMEVIVVQLVLNEVRAWARGML
jgi:hypothetical protein